MDDLTLDIYFQSVKIQSKCPHYEILLNGWLEKEVTKWALQ